MHNIKPLGTNILVEKDPRKELKVGDILIPECLERTDRYGPTVLATVVACGPKCIHLQEGMRIWLKDVAGDDWEIGGKRLTLLRERDIVGIDHTPSHQKAVAAKETDLPSHSHE